jgi:CRP-like cAMP-binding protein
MLTTLGKVYEDGEDIVRQGEIDDDHMYVIQEGEVEVILQKNQKALRLAVLGEGEIFGEMGVFEHRARAATVRALGRVRVLTVHRKTVFRSIQQDPSMALHLIETLSARVREEHEALLN